MAALSCSVVSAEAEAFYRYTFSGLGSGSLNGTLFSYRPFTFNLVGDTALYSPNELNGGHQINPLSSSGFSITGFDAGFFLVATAIGSNDTSSWLYFANASANKDLFNVNLGTPVYLTNATSPVESVYVYLAAHQFADIPTTKGNLSLNSIDSTVIFSSEAVPEPSTYALLLFSGAVSLWVIKRRKGQAVSKSSVTK